MTLGVLCSGRLGYTNLKSLCDDGKHEIKFVFTDAKSESIINLCKSLYIPTFTGNPRKGKSKGFLSEEKVDVLISINYLYIIEDDLISIANKIAFNIHGSLLPKYRGRTPHVWAIINGEKEAGITAHVIDAGCDTGDLLEQEIVEIDYHDTGAGMLKKYEEKYYQIIIRVLQKIESGNLLLRKQDDSKATFFGKRTPEDGEIDWGWQKERIRNWVRAQSFPYPGAFTYFKGNKVIIDEISFTDEGFLAKFENGLILETAGRVLAKTPNGVVELTKLRDNDVTFKKNEVLGK